MAETLAGSSQWYRGTTLEERLRSLRAHSEAIAARSDPGWDAELGERELASWAGQPPFDEGEWFAKRLLSEGVRESELLTLLGDSPESLAGRFPTPPPWLAELEEALAAPAPESPWNLPLPPALQGNPTVGFLGGVEPLIRRGRDRLVREAQGLRERFGAVPFEPEDVADLLLAGLALQLHILSMRVYVLELHIARMQGELPGESPEQRFQAFVAGLEERTQAVRILEEYPVLARLVLSTIDRWVRFGAEFLEHLCADWSSIQSTFGDGTPAGRLTELRGGAGDTHAGGKTVMVVAFESGLRLVYKPRSLAVDVHFQELLGWLNERGDHPPFRVLRVLEAGRHGWVEHAAPAPCSSSEEVERFFRRQGGLLALLFALEATDCHFENLIAAGEQPVFIDLESVFHSRVPPVEMPQPEVRLVTDATTQSCLRVGLLPHKSFAKEDYKGIDISGMGGAAGQVTPDEVMQWEGAGTDEMKAVRERVDVPVSDNLPRLGDVSLSPADYADEISRGFRDVYTLIQERAEELLAEGGPIDAFASDEVRSVVRATSGYGMLLGESYRPDFQRDALELERFFDRLWVGIEANGHLEPVIPAERRDLLAGDIPIFTTRVDSRHLWTSRGERIDDYWPESGLDLVRKRIAGLGADDLERQLWFVRASLATVALKEEKFVWPRYDPAPASFPLTPEELDARMLAGARRIGDQLERLALQDGEDLAWIGLAYANQEWSLDPLLDDLYAGSAGLALFFGYLGSVTGEARYTDLARRAAKGLRRRMRATSGVLPSIGAFNGLGGILYTFAHLGVLWDDAELLGEAEQLLEALPDMIEEDDALDVVGGAAGCIGGLLSLHRATGSERALELARRCGERIVAAARPMSEGVGWFTNIETETPITGFSHGASGMSWALTQLFRVTGEERLREVALDAVRYEHTQFVPEAGNWMDPEDTDKSGRPTNELNQALSRAWCYGAPGIGLARLRCLDVLDHPIVRRELEVALETTVETGLGANHCLCHGDLGNLDFLLEGSEVLGDNALRGIMERQLGSVLESMERCGFLCGVPLGVESPSLMNGLAGIGFGLLRLARRDDVPSVLALDPPPSAKS